MWISRNTPFNLFVLVFFKNVWKFKKTIRNLENCSCCQVYYEVHVTNSKLCSYFKNVCNFKNLIITIKKCFGFSNFVQDLKTIFRKCYKLEKYYCFSGCSKIENIFCIESTFSIFYFWTFKTCSHFQNLYTNEKIFVFL